MSRETIKAEAHQLVGPWEHVRCVDDGESVIVVLEQIRPSCADAYEPSTLDALAFRVPITYPDAEPDTTGFFVQPSGIVLRANRAAPASTSETTFLDATWRKFSWQHPKHHAWNPDIDNLASHVAMLDERFRRKA